MFKFIKNLMGEKNEVPKGDYIAAPLEGEIVPLTKVQDPVFSQKMMGDGFAINPSSGVVVSPVDGVVATIFHTKHAIGLKSNTGKEIIIHFGFETVQLKGEGFDVKVKEGDNVKAGDTLLVVGIETVKDKVPSLITPIVFPNLTEDETIKVLKNGRVSLGEKEIAVIKK